MKRYKCTTEFSRIMIVQDFIRLVQDWFDSKTNSFYGKREKCLSYLSYWAEKGVFGPDWDEHYLIHLETKFIEYFENNYDLIPEEKCKHEHYAIKSIEDFSFAVCSDCGFQWKLI